ncbi:hypothetical protein PTKIN_Ptkin03bG0141300 [Pterospermum kingtungense]
MGKLLTRRPFNKEAFMETMKAIWKITNEVEIMAIEENLFLFKFQGARDKERVLEGAPWSFDKSLLLFQEFNGALRPDEYVFDKATFWVRIYGLLLGMMNKTIGARIGESLGRLIKADKSLGKLIKADDSLDGGGWTTFVRLRVELNITKPLRRVIKLSSGEKQKGVCGRVAYERLPTFCYCYGFIGHADSECAVTINKDDGKAVSFQYGDWMQASPLKKGINFNRKESTKTKLKEFTAQLKATRPDQGTQSGGVAVGDGGVVRHLGFDDHLLTCGSTTTQKEREVSTKSPDVDKSLRKGAFVAELQQKIGNLLVGESKSGNMQGKGKSTCKEMEGDGGHHTVTPKGKDRVSLGQNELRGEKVYTGVIDQAQKPGKSEDLLKQGRAFKIECFKPNLLDPKSRKHAEDPTHLTDPEVVVHKPGLSILNDEISELISPNSNANLFQIKETILEANPEKHSPSPENQKPICKPCTKKWRKLARKEKEENADARTEHGKRKLGMVEEEGDENVPTQAFKKAKDMEMEEAKVSNSQSTETELIQSHRQP